MSQLGILIGAIVAAVVLFIVGFRLGITYRKKVAEKEVGSAEEQGWNRRRGHVLQCSHPPQVLRYSMQNQEPFGAI